MFTRLISGFCLLFFAMSFAQGDTLLMPVKCEGCGGGWVVIERQKESPLIVDVGSKTAVLSSREICPILSRFPYYDPDLSNQTLIEASIKGKSLVGQGSYYAYPNWFLPERHLVREWAKLGDSGIAVVPEDQKVFLWDLFHFELCLICIVFSWLFFFRRQNGLKVRSSVAGTIFFLMAGVYFSVGVQGAIDPFNTYSRIVVLFMLFVLISFVAYFLMVFWLTDQRKAAEKNQKIKTWVDQTASDISKNIIMPSLSLTVAAISLAIHQSFRFVPITIIMYTAPIAVGVSLHFVMRFFEKRAAMKKA